MALSIRDREVEVMARELARQRNTTMTDAIKTSLSNELKREAKPANRLKKLNDILDRLHARAKPTGHRMTKDEIDLMWGHE